MPPRIPPTDTASPTLNQSARIMSEVSIVRRRSSAVSRGSFASMRANSKVFPSIDALLDAAGFGWFTAAIVFTLSLAQMAQSLNTNLLSYLMPCAGENLGASPAEYGLLGTFMNTASYFGTLIFGAMADGWGRKPAVMLSVLLMAIAGSGAIFASDIWQLCGWMGLMGVGLGGTMVPFDLLSELAPPSTRGGVLNATNWFWSCGTVLVLFAAWLTVGHLVPDLIPAAIEPWRLMVLVVAVPVTISFLLCPIVLVESPHWLLEKGRRVEALAVLHTIARCNGHGMPGEQDANSLSNSLLADRDTPSTTLEPAEDAPADFTHTPAPRGGGGASASNSSSFATGVRACAAPLGLGGAVDILTDPSLRLRAILHWSLWLIAGFGWAGLVYFQSAHDPSPPRVGCDPSAPRVGLAASLRVPALVFSPPRVRCVCLPLPLRREPAIDSCNCSARTCVGRRGQPRRQRDRQFDLECNARMRLRLCSPTSGARIGASGHPRCTIGRRLAARAVGAARRAAGRADHRIHCVRTCRCDHGAWCECHHRQRRDGRRRRLAPRPRGRK